MTFTEWFDLSEKQIRAGVYQTDGYWSYWCGNYWHGQWITKERAFINQTFAGGTYPHKWRGIKK